MFQCSATAANQAMICSGVPGCWPAKARRFRMRWILSAMFSQLPDSGVYRGMMPWANSHSSSSGVLCPVRLSSTNNIRKGGSSAGRLGFTDSPCCQRCHASRDACAVGGGSGSPARISDSSDDTSNVAPNGPEVKLHVVGVVRQIDEFFVSVVKLPPRG